MFPFHCTISTLCESGYNVSVVSDYARIIVYGMCMVKQKKHQADFGQRVSGWKNVSRTSDGTFSVVKMISEPSDGTFSVEKMVSEPSDGGFSVGKVLSELRTRLFQLEKYFPNLRTVVFELKKCRPNLGSVRKFEMELKI